MPGSETSVELPCRLDDIDSVFLTSALRQRYPDTRVGAVEIADLRQGSASSLRLLIDYANNPHDLPPTMFMKGNFIDHGFTSAAAFAAETLYFSNIATTLSDVVTQPDAYFAGLGANGQAIVILEDLARRDVRFGDCDEPLDIDAVADGVRQLAAMQGRYWRGRRMQSFEWIEDIAAVASLMILLVQFDHFNDYIARERARFLPEHLRDRLKIENALRAMFETDKALPHALVHGDAHLGNTFRDSAGNIGFCDFQAVGRGPYIWDVTYFMTGALTPEDRAASERDLLKLYLDELRVHGADDVPSIDAAFLAHRRHMMHGYLNILCPTEMQPDRFAVAMGQRFAVAIEDLGTLESFD
ncbi:phosphotransferase [uncultured Mycobacterium sp.]|uniref:phosphotransferase n=1 Tax=uncultured Mycobacterium sp. TaxID=171292 RepID=UPI0035CA8003